MFKVIKSKKQTYLENKARGFTPPTLEELTQTESKDDESASTKTLSDTVFQGYRDDLDINDENDIGKLLATVHLLLNTFSIIKNSGSLVEEHLTIQVEGYPSEFDPGCLQF